MPEHEIADRVDREAPARRHEAGRGGLLDDRRAGAGKALGQRVAPEIAAFALAAVDQDAADLRTRPLSMSAMRGYVADDARIADPQPIIDDLLRLVPRRMPVSGGIDLFEGAHDLVRAHGAVVRELHRNVELEGLAAI